MSSRGTPGGAAAGSAVARLALVVRCSCGREFDTGIRMDRRNFDRATFAANYHVCPSCGLRGLYRKDDYRLVENGGGRDRA